MQKKEYKAPSVRTEKVTIGVFGDYGAGGDDGGTNNSPVQFLAPFFRLCCS